MVLSTIQTNGLNSNTNHLSDEQKKHYQKLYSEMNRLPEASRPNGYDKACKILAKDINSTIDDVLAMCKKAESYGYTDTSKFLENFNNALRRIPNYKNTELKTEDLNALMDIFNQCGGGIGGGMTSAVSYATFINKAQEYIKGVEIKQEREKLSGLKDQIYNDYQKPPTQNEDETPLPPARNFACGEEYIASLNQARIRPSVRPST